MGRIIVHRDRCCTCDSGLPPDVRAFPCGHRYRCEQCVARGGDDDDDGLCAACGCNRDPDTWPDVIRARGGTVFAWVRDPDPQGRWEGRDGVARATASRW